MSDFTTRLLMLVLVSISSSFSKPFVLEMMPILSRFIWPPMARRALPSLSLINTFIDEVNTGWA